MINIRIRFNTLMQILYSRCPLRFEITKFPPLRGTLNLDWGQVTDFCHLRTFNFFGQYCYKWWTPTIYFSGAAAHLHLHTNHPVIWEQRNTHTDKGQKLHVHIKHQMWRKIVIPLTFFYHGTVGTRWIFFFFAFSIAFRTANLLILKSNIFTEWCEKQNSLCSKGLQAETPYLWERSAERKQTGWSDRHAGVTQRSILCNCGEQKSIKRIHKTS